MNSDEKIIIEPAGAQEAAAAEPTPAPTGHPGEQLDQPIPADAKPTPGPAGHPGERLEQPIPADPIPTPAPESKPAGPKATVEHWAKKHGMLPKILDQPRIAGKAKGNAPEMQFRMIPGRINPKYDAFGQAKHHHGWPVGHEVTEEEFLAALEAPNAHVFR